MTTKIADIEQTFGAAIREQMKPLGLDTGDMIYVLRTGCYECDEADDHCAIGCKKKDVWYPEKQTVTGHKVQSDRGRIKIEILCGEEAFGLETLGDSLFTSRDAAIRKIIKRKENASC